MENRHLVQLRSGGTLTTAQQLSLIISLSIPAILSQLTSVVMEYIDAAMVGALGANASASIGLMSSSMWLIWGLCFAAATGFSVQVAHRVGAGDEEGARSTVRHGMATLLVFSCLIALICFLIGKKLPVWLGGNPDITADASVYFMIYIVFLPISQLRMVSGSMLQNSGNMKIPSTLNILTCFLDVFFNYLMIFPTRSVSIGNAVFRMPGAGLGVAGAAAGTVISETVCAAFMFFFLNRRFRLFDGAHQHGSYLGEMKRALQISLPLCMEQIVTNGAQVAFTRIVAPLGTIAIAAHSFSVTAESVCYMPGYGIAAAATALIGQSTGAGRKDLTKKLGYLTLGFGIAVQTLMGLLLFVGAPAMIGILTPDAAVRRLGTQVLRIEAFAEPLFAASIIVNGVFRGAGKTLVPSLLNFLSMWLIRIPLSALLAPHFGLPGVWAVMCAELCIRGGLFLVWMRREYH